MKREQALPMESPLHSKMLVGGLVVVGIGGLLTFAGVTMTAAVMVAAGRRWISHRDEAPADLARHKWEQAKAATLAGAHAWHDGANSMKVPVA